MIGLAELNSGMIAIGELYGHIADTNMDMFWFADMLSSSGLPCCASFTARRFEIISIERQVFIRIPGRPRGSPSHDCFQSFPAALFLVSALGGGGGGFDFGCGCGCSCGCSRRWLSGLGRVPLGNDWGCLSDIAQDRPFGFARDRGVACRGLFIACATGKQILNHCQLGLCRGDKKE